MKRRLKIKKQVGVALVLSIVLLLVMTILGVALVGGSVMQERMAGNQRLQTLAFEAASAGVAEALDWGLATDETGLYVNWTGTSCLRAEDEKWESEWSDARYIGGTESEYRLKIRCREDETFADFAGFAAAGEPIPPQLFVLSDGVVRGALGDVVARRQIEVRIENRGGTDGNIDPAIRVEGESIDFGPPNSNKFMVDGAGGASIATTEDVNATMVEETIAELANGGRVGNYPGGIEDGVGQYPFDSPENLADFVSKIKAELAAGSDCGNFVQENIQGAGVGDGSGGSPTCSDDGAENFADLSLSFSGNNLTYVTGDATIGPNLEGTGLLIVEGQVCLSGSADFKGQIIALGGLFEMYGGGNGRTEGAVFVADLDPDGSPTGWGTTTLDLSGGGNHRVTYECDQVADARDLALACDPSAASWQPLCDGEGGRGLGIGARIQMVGWRESLGWREDFFVDPEPEPEPDPDPVE